MRAKRQGWHSVNYSHLTLPKMNQPCTFRRIGNGWKCLECGYVHRKPSSRAPVRLCGTPARKATPNPKTPKKRPNRPPTARKRHIKPDPLKRKPLELGDMVHEALSIVGITPERVTAWMGRPCGCSGRRERLNNLSRWAKRVIAGKTEDAREYLEEIIDE